MIEISGLTKRFGAVTAVQDVTSSCRPGTVTGFLGPNGAGKSTTLRMLTGMTPPSAGTALVHGAPYRAPARPGRVVGVVLDAVAQHAGRTGRETLRLVASVLGVPRSRADEQLERVDLGRAGRRRVGTYSLDMRRRLGIAWMRHLLRGFAYGGGTVLLSSHLLREVEATADDLVVISGGRVLAQGSRQALLAGAGAGTDVRAVDPDALRRALEQAGLAWSPALDGSLRVDASSEEVTGVAPSAGVVLTALQPAGAQGLEDWFLTLTGGRS